MAIAIDVTVSIDLRRHYERYSENETMRCEIDVKTGRDPRTDSWSWWWKEGRKEERGKRQMMRNERYFLGPDQLVAKTRLHHKAVRKIKRAWQPSWQGRRACLL
jgi:hypothetical protein